MSLNRREWLLGTAALFPVFGKRHQSGPFEPHFLEIRERLPRRVRSTSRLTPSAISHTAPFCGEHGGFRQNLRFGLTHDAGAQRLVDERAPRLRT